MRKPVIVLWVLLLFEGFSFGPCLASSPAEDIPLDSWVYDAVFELSTQGHFADLFLHTRPYSRGDVTAGVQALIETDEALPLGTLVVLQRLRAEFVEELAALAETHVAEGEYIRYGGGVTARSDQADGGFSKNRVGADLIGSFGVGSSLAVRNRLRLDSDGRHDTQFRGEYWKEHFTAWIDQAVITARVGRFRGAFGRESWRWGRSPVDAMLISDQSPPFDGLRLGYQSQRWSFAFHATRLNSMTIDRIGSVERYLVGHRLDWRPRSNLEIAISEVVLFGGVNRPWELNYLNPLLPYYWEQLNNNTNDNPLWSLELSWRPRGALELYGEWLIDDFQIDFTSEPQQIGVLLGGAWSGGPERRLFVNGEYQRVNTFVYGQGRPYNRYFNRRDLEGRMIGIGSNLGPDSDRLTLRPRWHQSTYLDIVGILEHVRRGQDRIDSTQASGVPKNIPFPSGTVERRTTAGLGVHAQIDAHIILDVLVGFERVTSINNIRDADRNGIFFRARLVTLFWNTTRL